MQIYQRARGGPWWIDLRAADGRRIRRSLGTRDHGLAERMAYDMALGIAEGKALVGDEARVKVLIDTFLEQPHNLRPRSRERQVRICERLKAQLGNLKVTDRGFRTAVKGYRANRVSEGRAARTANHEVNVLHQVIKWAMDVYAGLIDPLSGLRRLRVKSVEMRALNVQEVARLLSVLETPEERLRVGLYLYSGMRRGEGTHLRWSDVDLKKGLLHITPHGGWSTKNGEARSVPICEALERILKEAPRLGIYVLTTRDGKPMWSDNSTPLLRWIRRRYKRAGLTNWEKLGVHTLRHTYCSHLARQNVSREVRAKLVGHRTVEMQDIYSHAFEEDVLEAGKGLRYA